MLVILGDGNGVWDDLSKIKGEYDVFAIGIAGFVYRDDLKYLGSVHPESTEHLVALRVHAGRNRPTTVGPYSCDVIREACSGSSGLYAAKFGAENYDEVVLCGCPMDGNGHFYDYYPNDGSFQFKGAEWFQAKKSWKGKVKSMSGNTRLWLAT